MSQEAQDPEVSKNATAAAAQAERILAMKPPETIKLANGIILHLQPVPPYAVTEAGIHVPRPKPPMVKVENKGDREVENLADPDYIEAMQKYEDTVMEARSQVMLLMGTRIEHVPEGLDRPEDDGWLEDLKTLGILVPTVTDRQRYLSWLKYYAIRTNTDFIKITNTIGLMANMISEEEVTQAVNSFRSGEVRGADNDSGSDSRNNQNGHHVSRPLRRASARNRRT